MPRKARRVVASFDSPEEADRTAQRLADSGISVDENAPEDADLAFAPTHGRGESAERQPATTVAAALSDRASTNAAVEELRDVDADVVAVEVEPPAPEEEPMTATEVRELMTSFPRCLTPDTDIEEAARLMELENIGDVLLCDGDRIVGIVTDRDITIRAVAHGKDPSTTRLADIASTDLTTVSADDRVDDAVRLMRDRALRRLPVVDDTGAPIGVVSLGDLAQELDSSSALADISAAPANT